MKASIKRKVLSAPDVVPSLNNGESPLKFGNFFAISGPNSVKPMDGALQCQVLPSTSLALHDIPTIESPNLTEKAKIEKNRERNRIHAKKTRKRKKDMMDSLKNKIIQLQQETIDLEQKLEENSTANILLHLADLGPSQIMVREDDTEIAAQNAFRAAVPSGDIIEKLRQKARVDALGGLKDNLPSSSQATSVVGSSSSSSMTVPSTDQYDQLSESCDEVEAKCADDEVSEGNDVDTPDANKLQIIRRERNRIHAKLTRDRRKIFTQELQQTIDALEKHNGYLREKLVKQCSCV